MALGSMAPMGGIRYHKGLRYQRRQLPRRLASVAAALLLWTVIGWWVVGGGRQIAQWGVSSGHPWLPSLAFAATVPLLWSRGNDIMDRALRTVPRLLYSMHVDHWKLLVFDTVSRPVARYTTVALMVIMLNMSLHHAPAGAKITLPRLLYADAGDQVSGDASDAAPPPRALGAKLFFPRPFYADADSAEPSDTFEVDASAVAEALCPISRTALRALAVSTFAYIALQLRHPPSFTGSRSFRLVPLRRRGDKPNTCVKAPSGIEVSPCLILYKNGLAVAMPPPTECTDKPLPMWTFAEPLAIDEYSWATARDGDPECDPVEWRLEALRGDGEDVRWHGIHETDASMVEDVPLERGAPILKRYIAPNGEVPRGERGVLGCYYRALQRPREDRDRCAVALLVQSMVVVPLVFLGLLPWLSVVGVELGSVVGMTSVGGVTAGAALSLAKSEVLENLFAGTLLSAQGHIIHGDEVEIRYQVGNSQQSLRGVVVRIGSAYVSMIDEEGRVAQIPNRKVLGSIVRSNRAAADAGGAGAGAAEPRDRSGTALGYLARRV